MLIVEYRYKCEEHYQHQHHRHNSRYGIASIAFEILLMAEFACHNRFYHSHSGFNPAIIVVFAEVRNHLVANDVAAECIGEHRFHAIAGGNKHFAATAFGFGFHQYHHSGIVLLVAHAPLFAYAVSHLHRLEAAEIAHRHHGNAVGGFASEGLE